MPTLDNVQSLAHLGDLWVLLGGAIAVLLWDLWGIERRGTNGAGQSPRIGTYTLALLTLAFAVVRATIALQRHPPPVHLFFGMLVADPMAHIFCILFATVTAVALVVGYPTEATDRPDPQALSMSSGPPAKSRRLEPVPAGDLVALQLALAFGMTLMAMSRNVAVFYLALELVSIVSFVLAASGTGWTRSGEGALKYVVFGACASGTMLYGASWLYGVAGSLDFGVIGQRIADSASSEGGVPGPLFFAMVCLLAGVGYKISAVPFHMWTPDVYEGADPAITALFSVGPKAAGIAALIRVSSELFPSLRDRTHPQLAWVLLISTLALLSMFVGNLAAISQSNIKRMLAYSGIAHAGYLLLGTCAFTDAGTSAQLFFLVVYATANLCAFSVLTAVSLRSAGDETLRAFEGLGTRAPVLAACMSISLFSLAGLPPFAGFVGKMYLLAELIHRAGTKGLTEDPRFTSVTWILAAAAVVNSVIALFYYARILRAMYLQPVETKPPLRPSKLHVLLCVILAVPTLGLGITWGPLHEYLSASVHASHTSNASPNGDGAERDGAQSDSDIYKGLLEDHAQDPLAASHLGRGAETPVVRRDFDPICPWSRTHH